MELRWQGFNRRLHFSFEKVEQVTGVNSNIDEKTHFLMWDFDDLPLPDVVKSLQSVQRSFFLPAITIINTGKPNGYHAYCFKACSYIFARMIIAATVGVDKNYLALGIARGYFTLRFTEIYDRYFEPVGILESKVPADCSYKDVCCFVNYTKRRKS